VDGFGDFNRKLMAQEALRCLKTEGLTILDNSDCNVKAAELLRNVGLLQVDFHGISPGVYTSTNCTS
jgi:hypothetical protein